MVGWHKHHVEGHSGGIAARNKSTGENPGKKKKENISKDLIQFPR